MSSLLALILTQVLKLVTPVLRDELSGFLKSWTAKAYATPNKWDDVAAKVVTSILSVDISAIPLPTEQDAIANAVSGALLEVATGKSPFDAPGNELGGA